MRVAFIGSSHVHTADYLAVCRTLPWVDLVGIARVDPETRSQLPDLPPLVAEQQDLPSHDLAVVVTDIVSHEQVCAHLAAPAVFVEKPLAVNGECAARLARRLAHMHVDVGFFLRHSRAFKALADASQDAAMGDLQFARFAFAHPGLRDGWLRSWPAHMTPARMGGGAFFDLAVHLVEAAQGIIGPLRATACDRHMMTLDINGGSRELEVQGQATLVSGNQALVHLWASAVAPRVMLAVDLVYENGRVTLDGGRVARQFAGEAPKVLRDGPMPTPADGFRAALEAFRDGRAPIIDLRDAVRASEIMDALAVAADPLSDTRLERVSVSRRRPRLPRP